MCFCGDLDYELPLFRLVHCAWRIQKTSGNKFHASIFSSRFYAYCHAQLSERGNTPSLMAILYFVEQKRFVAQGRLESPSLLCVLNQLRGERRLRILKKKNHNNNNKLDKINKTTKPSKIDAIFARRMYVSLFLCLVLAHLGPVKGISHRKSI